ncbi:MAG: hypothetical protein ABJA78_01965 [Ferruginibacter sp.]
MKKMILLLCVCIYIMPAQAQLLKKLKDKVNKGVDKAVDKTVTKTTGTDTDKPQTQIEKKEAAASDQYSDVTENNEKPIFVDAAPANSKMVLKLKKGDRFWGGYITVTGRPRKGDVNPNVLDFINVRVGSFYTAGEISSYAVYFDGQRLLNDSSAIPLRPEFISYEINKTPFFISTEAKVGTPDPMAAVAAAKAKGNNLTKEDEAQFAKTMGGQITQATFTFKYNGKTYGPFEGVGEKMLVLKSMTDGKPTQKFYGFGAENYVSKKEFGMGALIQTETNVVRVKDYVLTTLALSYPTGCMAFAPGGKMNTFSNGKTVPVIEVAGIQKSMYEALPNGGKFFSEIYGTDSGHVIGIVTEVDKTNHMAKTPVEAIVDYKTVLSYPVEITKQNLLVAGNPAKSVLYKMHTIYYPDGSKETIDNVGNAQLVGFNGKEYIVWFAMTKVADGHEIYVCQKELK